jgi:hypothetical protein
MCKVFALLELHLMRGGAQAGRTTTEGGKGRGGDEAARPLGSSRPRAPGGLGKFCKTTVKKKKKKGPFNAQGFI